MHNKGNYRINKFIHSFLFKEKFVYSFCAINYFKRSLYIKRSLRQIYFLNFNFKVMHSNKVCCFITGNSRATLSYLYLSRQFFKKLATNQELSGIQKSSW